MGTSSINGTFSSAPPAILPVFDSGWGASPFRLRHRRGGALFLSGAHPAPCRRETKKKTLGRDGNRWILHVLNGIWAPFLLESARFLFFLFFCNGKIIQIIQIIQGNWGDVRPVGPGFRGFLGQNAKGQDGEVPGTWGGLVYGIDINKYIYICIIYIYMCIYICVYIYIHTSISR